MTRRTAIQLGGGIMGGLESEVTDNSKNILLEAAAWNFINIRRTSQALNISSEAGYRLSRGVHPSTAMLGDLRGAKLIAELSGGSIEGLLDYYPNPPEPVVVDLPQAEVTRLLGIEISMADTTGYSEAVAKAVEIEEKTLSFCLTAAEQSKSLMADVPRAFSLIARKRNKRIEMLKIFLDNKDNN